MPHKLIRPTRGGARPGSGRPRKERRPVSARVDLRLYDKLRRHAAERKITLSDLIEDALKEKFGTHAKPKN